MKANKPLVIAIAAVSGGGKTAVTTQLNKILPNTKSIFFDDYDFDGPDSICDWVERGADYNEYDLTPLINDYNALISNSREPLDYILLDYPFAYLQTQMSKHIDFTIFIDAPLDIAMARRLIRDFKDAPIEDVHSDLENYLLHARPAYLSMLNNIKPNSELIIDGSLSVDMIANQISERIHQIPKYK